MAPTRVRREPRTPTRYGCSGLQWAIRSDLELLADMARLRWRLDRAFPSRPLQAPRRDELGAEPCASPLPTPMTDASEGVANTVRSGSTVAVTPSSYVASMASPTIDDLLGINHRPPHDEERFGVAVLRPKWVHRTARVTTRRFGRERSATWTCGSASVRPALFPSLQEAESGWRDVSPCPSCARSAD